MQKKISGKIRNDDERALDEALGLRIKARRIEAGLTQDELAQACGITFQQVQKYEKGINRIAFSRLVRIARALEISIPALVEGLDHTTTDQQFVTLKMLNEPLAFEMLHAFSAITERAKKKQLLEIAATMKPKRPKKRKRSVPQ